MTKFKIQISKEGILPNLLHKKSTEYLHLKLDEIAKSHAAILRLQSMVDGLSGTILIKPAKKPQIRSLTNGKGTKKGEYRPFSPA